MNITEVLALYRFVSNLDRCLPTTRFSKTYGRELANAVTASRSVARSLKHLAKVHGYAELCANLHPAVRRPGGSGAAPYTAPNILIEARQQNTLSPLSASLEYIAVQRPGELFWSFPDVLMEIESHSRRGYQDRHLITLAEARELLSEELQRAKDLYDRVAAAVDRPAHKGKPLRKLRWTPDAKERDED